MKNSFKIAFSMYSRIPMPEAEWTKENLAYVFVFFPWIGAVIGALMYGAFRLKEFCLAGQVGLSELFFAVLMTMIPLAVTGGIHMDGFLDTQDALRSCQSREKKLEILKDPHAGAFAMIAGGVYLLCSLGVYSCVDEAGIGAVCFGFVLSRTWSGLAVLCFPQARKEGLSASFSESGEKRRVTIVLAAYLACLCAAMVFLCGVCGIAAFVAAGLVFWYDYHMMMKNFGGVTGDLAGYFLQRCELAVAAAAVAARMLSHLL